jgi:hypothetical protein
MTKKGGNSKGKNGKKQGGGKKKLQPAPPRVDKKPGFVLPEAEKGFVPGFGCMVTKKWADAKSERRFPLLLEISRAYMQQYWDKVTDAQSKASLLRMLGQSLIGTCNQKEAKKYALEAVELIQSMGERSAKDIVYGVWPEDCFAGLPLSPSPE